MEARARCPKCNTPAGEPARFCGQCGWDLTKPFARLHIGAKGLLLTAALAAILWGSGTALQNTHAGTKPTRPYRPEAASAPSEPDPALDALRSRAQSQTPDLASLRALADGLIQRLQAAPETSPALALEATDVLGQILRMDPKDREALIALADVSFNQKVFDKAVGLYQRYLELEPDDLSARSRYASSLAFIGKTSEAIKELETVLVFDPENFHALAYLSITYAQTGNNAKALEIGKKALTTAPSPEARERFDEFLKALAAQKNPAAAPAAASASAPAAGGLEGVAAFVAQNPVAGPKYVRYEALGSDTLRLYFRSFPMEAMPPMAKDKFYSGIKAKISELKLGALKKVVFLDADSGMTLDTLAIP